MYLHWVMCSYMSHFLSHNFTHTLYHELVRTYDARSIVLTGL